MTGSGDIVPAIPGPGNDVASHNPIVFFLTGAVAGLIAVIVVATMFMTAEYRRGLIRTTLAASPSRGRVLAAKAIVIGAAAFVTGLAAAFAVQQSMPQYQQVQASYTPMGGFFPLAPWAGFAVLCGWAALALAAAACLLRRRDA